MPIKRILKTVLPAGVRQAIRNMRASKPGLDYTNLSTQQVFARIYEVGAWGRSQDPSQPYFSGTGSHDDAVVSTYVEAVQSFLASFTRKPDVVDLGCGDFSVGSRLRHHCGSYTACDVVPGLIDFNRQKFADLAVDFRVLDLITDALPDGEVVFIRQVLQHLSNEHIKLALPKLRLKYRYLVVTEHLPRDQHFKPNRDKPLGPNIRTDVGSGIVLSRPPFRLKSIRESTLCRALVSDGVIVTTLYQFRD